MGKYNSTEMQTQNSLFWSCTGLCEDNSTTAVNFSSTQGISTADKPSESETRGIYSVGLIICVAGLLLQIFMCSIILCGVKGKWKKQMFLLLNISVCDILICASGVVIYTMRFMDSELKMDKVYGSLSAQQIYRCAIEMSNRLWDVGTNANTFGLMIMTIDHLVAIRWPMKHAMIIERKSTIICVTAAWLIAAVLGFLSSMLISSSYDPVMDSWPTKGTTKFCYQVYVYRQRLNGEFLFPLHQDNNRTAVFRVGATVIAVVILSMIGTYGYIIKVIVERMSQTQFSQHGHRFQSGVSLKGVWTSVTLVASFMVLWLPLFVFYIYNELSKQVMSDKDLFFLRESIFIVSNLTGIVDAVIYLARNQDVQRACKDVFCFVRPKSQSHQTITMAISVTSSP